MASTRRKSAAIALAVVGIAGLSLASAATLTVNAGSLGAGTTTLDAACDAAVDADFTTVFNATTGAYDVDSLTVSGIDDTACAGQTIRVTVTDTTTSTIVLDDASTTVTAASLPFALDSDAPAADDFDIAIVIHS